MVNAENISTLDALAITLIMKTTFAPFYRFKWKEILVRFGKYVNVAAHSIRMFHFVKFPCPLPIYIHPVPNMFNFSDDEPFSNQHRHGQGEDIIGRV